VIQRRLKVFVDPGGKPFALFPDDVKAVISVQVPEKSGLKNEKGEEIPAEPKYRKDLSAIILRDGAQMVAKSEVQETVNMLNQYYKWQAENEG